MDPTACDKYDLPETNLRMCSRSPNIYGHDTSQPRTLEPQGLTQRRSLSKQKDSDTDSSSSSDEDTTNKQRTKKLRRKRKCTQICLILVAIVIVLLVTNTVTLTAPSKPLMTYMPSWNNYT